MKHELDEKPRRLWGLVASPAIWALHFLLSYSTAAVYCAKFAAPGGSLWNVQVAIALYTLFALVPTFIIGWGGWKRHRSGNATLPHDSDSHESRARFLGFATLLLSGLSAIAIIYAALVVVFIGSCR